MEALFDMLAKIGGAGWIVAAVFGYGFWRERNARDETIQQVFELQKATLEAIHNNTTALNTITTLAGK